MTQVPPIPPGPPAPSQPTRTFGGSGRDPVFISSMGWSVGVHVAIVVLVMVGLWLSGLLGGRSVNPYLVPGGGGGGGVMTPQEVVRIVKAKSAKRHTYMLRMNSPISFFVPKIDDSSVANELDRVTQNAYQGGGIGKGKGFGHGPGSAGGWGGGDPNGIIRFIRLQHGGSGWDDGMEIATRADANFLDALRDVSKLKTAANSEAHPIELLKQYPKGRAPPFVYITGNGPIGLVDGDVKVLRQYLTDGGMLWGDCGSPTFAVSFQSLVAAIFPNEPLADIPNDDPIFQAPFPFPNGAPGLWHHGGSRAMGVKYQGRWAVFYFPGDMKDAWKTGHSGLAQDLANQALRLGMNVVSYALTTYTDLHPHK